jgi:hypothetical protein
MIVLRSKRHRKVARDTPLEKILLETDSPWLGDSGRRNDPTSIKIVAKEIAEIKNIGPQQVWNACARNAKDFFGLSISLQLQPIFDFDCCVCPRCASGDTKKKGGNCQITLPW